MVETQSNQGRSVVDWGRIGCGSNPFQSRNNLRLVNAAPTTAFVLPIASTHGFPPARRAGGCFRTEPPFALEPVNPRDRIKMLAGNVIDVLTCVDADITLY